MWLVQHHYRYNSDTHTYAGNITYIDAVSLVVVAGFLCAWELIKNCISFGNYAISTDN